MLDARETHPGSTFPSHLIPLGLEDDAIRHPADFPAALLDESKGQFPRPEADLRDSSDGDVVSTKRTSTPHAVKTISAHHLINVFGAMALLAAERAVGALQAVFRRGICTAGQPGYQEEKHRLKARHP